MAHAAIRQSAGLRIVLPLFRRVRYPELDANPVQDSIERALAYHVALLKGTDVDQPRNLAKSVTVE